MRKDEIRSQIKNFLPRFEETKRFHDRVLDAAIEKALAEFYNIIFLRNPHELERYTKTFGYVTALTVLYEGTTHLYYTNYPASVIPIPDKASGVRRVSNIIQGSAAFYPMDSREYDLVLNGSYVDTISSKIGYIPRRTRVEYYDPTGTLTTSSLVRMDILIPFSQYDADDTVLVPEIVNEQGLGFTDRVLQMFEKMPPVDLVENTKAEEVKRNG